MFKLTLVTPDKKLLADTEIDEIFVPGFRGELNILPGHAPLLTTLEPGVLRYRLKGQSDLHIVVVSWGYCEVNPHGVMVLAETAERPEDIDQDRALAAWKLSQERIDSGELDEENLEKYRRKQIRSELRRKVLQAPNDTTH